MFSEPNLSFHVIFLAQRVVMMPSRHGEQQRAHGFIEVGAAVAVRTAITTVTAIAADTDITLGALKGCVGGGGGRVVPVRGGGGHSEHHSRQRYLNKRRDSVMSYGFGGGQSIRMDSREAGFMNSGEAQRLNESR